jgi:hypothetical protein
MYGLSNEQLVFIYFSLNAVKMRYDEVLGKGKITQMIMAMGGIETTSHISPEIIHDLANSEHYSMLKDTVAKLEPIYELILDVEPDMVARIKKTFDV